MVLYIRDEGVVSRLESGLVHPASPSAVGVTFAKPVFWTALEFAVFMGLLATLPPDTFAMEASDSQYLYHCSVETASTR